MKLKVYLSATNLLKNNSEFGPDCLEQDEFVAALNFADRNLNGLLEIEVDLEKYYIVESFSQEGSTNIVCAKFRKRSLKPKDGPLPERNIAMTL